MFDIQHSEQQNVSSYKNYPVDKPFINSDWVRPSRALSKAYPESNRDLIMSSLKKLQEKINRLELKSDAPSPVKQINDIEDQSTLTENRIFQLEKQLEKMRNMVNNEQQPSKTNDDWLSSNKRLKNLEKETLLFDAEQQFTDTHMKHLEDKLKSNEPKQRSKSHRKHKNRKSKQSTKDKAKYVPDNNNNNNERYIKEYRKIKRSHSVDNACCTRTFTHYRLNIADIPFVVGKSITPSHHLGSNIQNVISLLKLHHPKLCNSVAHTKGNYQAALPSTLVKHNSRNKKKKRQPNLRSISVPPTNNNNNDDNNFEIPIARMITTRSPKDDASNNNTNRNGNFYYEYLNENELRELLRQMQEEYTKLVLEHYEITKRIMNCLDEKVRDDYELKAAELDHRMRKKASQIAKIKQFQNRNFSNKNPKYTKLSIDPAKRSNSIRKILRNLSTTTNGTATTPTTTTTTSTSSTANIINSTNDVNTSNNNTNYTINSDFPHFMSPYSFAFLNTNISNEQKNHNKSLKFFKDIKNLQNRIQNDQVIF